MLSANRIAYVAISVLLVMLSAIIHEVAHGWAALKCGDATAKEAGRLTLDPRRHLDTFGSVILPLMMGLAGGPVFAYAKPVPYNPRRLRNPRRDEFLVALAGPASNLLQAGVGAILTAAVYQGALAALDAGLIGWQTASGIADWGLTVTTAYVYVNLVLCFFNLIPLPPLDGSKLILFFLKGEARERFYLVSQYSMAILLVAMYLLPTYLNVDPVGAWLDLTAGHAYDALMTLALG